MLGWMYQHIGAEFFVRIPGAGISLNVRANVRKDRNSGRWEPHCIAWLECRRVFEKGGEVWSHKVGEIFGAHDWVMSGIVLRDEWMGILKTWRPR